MKPTKLHRALKILVIAGTLGMMNFYHQSLPPLQTFAQIEFEQWLKKVRSDDGTPRKNIPWISLTLKVGSKNPTTHIVEVEKGKSLPEERNDVVRLLELISDRQYLNWFAKEPTDDLFAVLTLRREGDEQNIFLPTSHVKGDIKTQTFIRLFQLFAERSLEYDEKREMMAKQADKIEPKKQEGRDEKS